MCFLNGVSALSLNVLFLSIAFRPPPFFFLISKSLLSLVFYQGPICRRESILCLDLGGDFTR